MSESSHARLSSSRMGRRSSSHNQPCTSSHVCTNVCTSVCTNVCANGAWLLRRFWGGGEQRTLALSVISMVKSEEDRVVRPNDAETVYNITIEILDQLTGGRDATKQRLEQIDFSNRRFQLLSLRGIEFIGHHNHADRDAVSMIMLGNNQLTSLVDLILADKSSPLFRRVENIFAPHNYIRNLCSTVHCRCRIHGRRRWNV